MTGRMLAMEASGNKAANKAMEGNVNIDQRLDLILEAVRYCQHVKSMGMPSVCYSKALCIG